MTTPPRRIFVVEDDEHIRMLVETLLKGAGYQVTCTGQPQEALEIARREIPDLVLCDIAMPVLDGYGVLRELQADPETARIPVVFLTAHREFSERVQAFRFGVVDYMTKPFTRELLLKRIDKILAGLVRRSGHLAAAQGHEEVERLVAEVKRDARTGVRQLRGEQGETSRAVRAGEIQGSPVEPEAVSQAQFLEMDPVREDAAPHDPVRLPGDAAGI